MISLCHTLFLSRLRERRLLLLARIATVFCLALLVAALAGCGGGSGSGSPVYMRAINACPNGGQMTLQVNGSATNGSQGFFLASPYLYVGDGSTNVSFALSANSGTSYQTINQSLTDGGYYSSIVFGRADVTSTSDPRYPKVQLATDDRTVPPTGDARLRIVHAAPDASNVDVLIDGQVVASNVAYGKIGSYLNVTAGNRTVQINQAGTSTALVTAQQVTLTAGQIYSLFAVEPTVTPSPVYGIQLLSDAN